ncbi:uncharacterized protein LOC144096612 isoform X2 [Amblyomma americanum]
MLTVRSCVLFEMPPPNVPQIKLNAKRSPSGNGGGTRSAMASSSASSAPAEDANLLYPELMSAATIIKILKERYVKHPRLEELDKAALVHLYEKTVLPLPQREYSDTRTGRALAALRERADSRRKRKASTDASSDPPSTKKQREASGACSEPSTSRVREPPSDQRRQEKSASVDAERRAERRPQGSRDRESSSTSGHASADHVSRHTSSSDPTRRANQGKPDAAGDNRRRSQPNEASSDRDKNGGSAANDSGEWGSWDDEPQTSTGRTSTTNRCHGEGDGPPRKKHRTPITWP